MEGETNHTTPQLYIQETSVSHSSIPFPGETAAIFIGYTPAGASHLLEPVEIGSMQQYTDTFGVETITTETGLRFPLYYHLELYFHNGGERCWIVSAGNDYTKKSLGGDAVNPPGLIDGLKAARMVDEANLICIPEAIELVKGDYVSLVQAMLSHCATMPNCFALIDVQDGHSLNAATITDLQSAVGTAYLQYGAAYFPYLQCPFTIGSTINVLSLPPSSAIAGVIASVDRSRGIWKAPANVTLKNVDQPALLLNEQQQEQLTSQPGSPSINVIRSFVGETKVWGARTLETDNTERKYIAVQRMIMTVGNAIGVALQPYIFEANDQASWTSIRTVIENYLLYFWNQGALQGTTTQDAFFVHVGPGQTMTQADIDSGKMIIEIGIALMRPAEFIILRIAQQTRV